MSGETLIEMRKNAVRGISTAEDKAHYIEQNADTLFSMDLTMYTGNATLNSLFYNAIASSKLDSNISLCNLMISSIASWVILYFKSHL